MINVNLLKEIETKSKEKQANDMEIVKQVQLLLDSKGQEEKQILEKCGLNHHITVAENITGESIERKSFFEKYGQALTTDQVEAICYKYALRCLSIDYYKGNIGPNVSSDIKRFVEKHQLEGELNSGNFKRCLYIMAPKDAFKLEAKPKDPVLFYNPNRYNSKENMYIPISKWGNDFTLLRMINGLFTRKILLPFFLISMTLTVINILMSSILFSVVTLFVLSLVLMICLLSGLTINDIKEYYHECSYNPFSEFEN